MQEVYIVSAVRTPIGRFGGSLADLSPVHLGAIVMVDALRRAQVPPEAIDRYVFGNVLRAGHGQLLPRQAALAAGIPETSNGFAIDMVCSSGMMSVMTAATAIATGETDLVLAGGLESMSQAGLLLSHRMRWGAKLLLNSTEQIIDLLVCDGLTDPTTGEKMGDQAERLATAYDVHREELDMVALYSQERANAATQAGWLAKEITAVEVNAKGKTQLIEKDEGIRADTTIEKLSALKPVFKPDGVFTAGNSSQISDGAAALLLASPRAIAEYGLKPLARIIKGTLAGGETWRYPEVPIHAVKKLFDLLNMQALDFDLFENNEAFALSSVLFNRVLGIPYDKLNVFGGAIALGHPIGASGARILVTLLNALQHQDGQFGLASVCHGSGGGTAIAIERLK